MMQLLHAAGCIHISSGSFYSGCKPYTYGDSGLQGPSSTHKINLGPSLQAETMLDMMAPIAGCCMATAAAAAAAGERKVFAGLL
jgi:hypothetical protein